MDLRESIVDRDVLIVEDIVDTGLTLAYLKRNFLTRKPRSLKMPALSYPTDSAWDTVWTTGSFTGTFPT